MYISHKITLSATFMPELPLLITAGLLRTWQQQMGPGLSYSRMNKLLYTLTWFLSWGPQTYSLSAR